MNPSPFTCRAPVPVFTDTLSTLIGWFGRGLAAIRSDFPKHG